MNLDKAFLEQHWPISKVKEIVIVTERGERKLYKVTTDNGTYAFKIADRAKTNEGIVEKDTTMIEFLNAQSFPAPKLIKTKDGTNFVAHNGRFVYALEFIDGKEPEPTIENYRLLGELTGALHSIKSSYSHKTDYIPENIIPSLQERARKYNLDKRYIELINSAPSFTGLPTTIIHTDIGLHNTIQKPNGEIVMLDWDDAGIGYPVLDLGWVLINSFFRDDYSYESDKAKAFFEGYNSKRKITEQERRHIFWGGFLICLDYAFSPDGTMERWPKVQYIADHREMFEGVLKV